MDYVVLADQIASWLQDKLEEANASGFVVGLSGGIDSATTAALCRRAGTAVLALWMPCESSAEDEQFARMAAESLLEELPEGNQMARANLKPRLRMATLYYLAQSRSFLVAGTGNRAELMVGFFTKYGDGGVDLEPLGALYKHEVRALANVLGLPRAIIQRTPSPGLWPGQTDEGEMGITYAEIDAILAAWDTGKAPDLPADRIAKVQGMVAQTAHKRAVPPVFPVKR
jgi:NAD+ synthase